MYKVYLFRQLDLIPSGWAEDALFILPEERMEKAMRYRQELDRKNCVISYLLLKHALMECFGITEFVMRNGKYGKPFLPQYPSVHFNISHCHQGCAVAVSDTFFSLKHDLFN